MTLNEAFEALKAAGLYVRQSGYSQGLGDEVCLHGGSHLDAPNALIRMVENGFGIFPEGQAYRVRLAGDAQTPGVSGLSLEAAVSLVIEKVKPQPNIEASPRPPIKGTTLY